MISLYLFMNTEWHLRRKIMWLTASRNWHSFLKWTDRVWGRTQEEELAEIAGECRWPFFSSPRMKMDSYYNLSILIYRPYRQEGVAETLWKHFEISLLGKDIWYYLIIERQRERERNVVIWYNCPVYLPLDQLQFADSESPSRSNSHLL